MKKTIILITLFIIISIGFLLFFESNKSITISEVTPAKAREKIKKGEYDIIIDVRTPEEFKSGKLKSL